MIDKSYYKNMPAKNTLNDDNNIHTNDYYTSLEDIPLENMIINSNLSVSDICYDSGFSNLSWFYSEFKKHSGMTPGEFRKKFG